MKTFETLTHQGQIKRLRQLASEAVKHYPLHTRSLKTIHHGENTTFELNADHTGDAHKPRPHHHPTRFLVRVHRLGYNSAPQILSELSWLEALDQQALPVQLPLANHDDQVLTTTTIKGIEQPRHCSVLRWSQGRFADKPTPKHFEQIGALTAKLHAHSRQWSKPEGFDRRCLTPSTFLSSMLSHDPLELLRDELDAAQRGRVTWALRQIERTMNTLGQDPEVFGLIHSDLHFGNVIFTKAGALPLDFDDCCSAHYIYDIATTLGTWRRSNLFEDFLAAYKRGYSSVMAWPEYAQEHLDAFELMRLVIMLVWTFDRAKDTPRFIELKPKIISRAMDRLEHARASAKAT